MMNVKIKVYNGLKYKANSEKVAEVEYTIKGYKVVGENECEEIERWTDDDGIDDYHEYLVLTLENGETATFRNSYVDMFFIHKAS